MWQPERGITIEYAVKRYGIIPVPHLMQPRGSNWCWAACARMILSFKNPSSTTTLCDVVKYFFPDVACGETDRLLQPGISLPYQTSDLNKAGNTAMVKHYLKDAHQIESGLNSVSSEKDLDFIEACLGKGWPVVLGYGGKNYGHMVVVTGLIMDRYGVEWFVVNDPAETSPRHLTGAQLLDLDDSGFRLETALTI